MEEKDKKIVELETKLAKSEKERELDNSFWKQECDSLQKQLHDLPKKIVGEIEEEIVKYDLLKNFPNEAGYCMFHSILDTILEKYGEEDEERSNTKINK